MKKLILLLLFIPLVSIGQDQTTIVGVKSTTKIVNERELVLSEASTNVRVPLTADLSNYTEILIVKGVLMNKEFKYNSWAELGGGVVNPISNKKTYETLSLS